MRSKPRGSPEERFWRQVDVSDGCWQWTGSPNCNGYGRLRLSTRHILAHRFAYELFVGPIPDGLCIDHLCRNRMCVNPAHLEPVTLGENSRRGERHTNGNERKTHCPVGHPYDATNTVRVATGRGCRLCIKEAQRRYRLRKRGFAA